MRLYTSNITQRSNVMLSEVEASKNRSLLKVNEILCNEYNTAIRLAKPKFIQKDEVQGLRSF